MKGFLVVDRLNDIQFIETDKEFARHINEQAKELGLINVSSQINQLKPLKLHSIRMIVFFGYYYY